MAFRGQHGSARAAPASPPSRKPATALRQGRKFRMWAGIRSTSGLSPACSRAFPTASFVYFTAFLSRPGHKCHRRRYRIWRAVQRGRRIGQHHGRAVSPGKIRRNRAAGSSQFPGVETMLTRRIIACLDVNAGRVVKGVQFVDLVDAGDPAELAARHAASGADEIVFLDITATHEARGTLLETVRRAARRALRAVHGRRRHPHRGRSRRGLRCGRGQSQHQLRGACAAGADR